MDKEGNSVQLKAAARILLQWPELYPRMLFMLQLHTDSDCLQQSLLLSHDLLLKSMSNEACTVPLTTSPRRKTKFILVPTKVKLRNESKLNMTNNLMYSLHCSNMMSENSKLQCCRGFGKSGKEKKLAPGPGPRLSHVWQEKRDTNRTMRSRTAQTRFFVLHNLSLN